MPLLAVYTKLYLAPYKLATVVIGGAGGGSGTSLDFHIDRFLLADPSHDGAVNGRLDNTCLRAFLFFETEVISVL